MFCQTSSPFRALNTIPKPSQSLDSGARTQVHIQPSHPSYLISTTTSDHIFSSFKLTFVGKLIFKIIFVGTSKFKPTQPRLTYLRRPSNFITFASKSTQLQLTFKLQLTHLPGISHIPHTIHQQHQPPPQWQHASPPRPPSSATLSPT